MDERDERDLCVDVWGWGGKSILKCMVRGDFLWHECCISSYDQMSTVINSEW